MTASATSSSPASVTKENICRINYYALFGLSAPTTTAEAAAVVDETEMRRRYRRFSLLFHPDKDPSPEARAAFEYVNLALETLLDDTLRRQYDISLRGGGGGLSSASSSSYSAAEAAERRRAAEEAEEILRARDAQQRAAREAQLRAAEAKATYARQLVEELTHSADTPFREMEAALVRDWEIDEDLLRQKETEVMGFLQELRRFYAQEETVDEQEGRKKRRTD